MKNHNFMILYMNINIVNVSFQYHYISNGSGRLRHIIVGKQYDHGDWCSTGFDDIISDEPIYRGSFKRYMTCTEHEWVIDWDADDLGKKKGLKNCVPASSPTTSQCSHCICARDQSYVDDCTDHDGFYWGRGESNIDQNKVITDVMMFETGNLIRIQTKQGILLRNGQVDHHEDWKNPTHEFSTDISCNYFSNTLRTFFLDEIVLPAKYVVTGIRIVAIEKTAGRKGWKLQVKGTEYDSSFTLKKSTDQWFDYTNSSNKDISYNRARNEIKMTNCYSEDNEPIKGTNYYVRIRAARYAIGFPLMVVPIFGRKTIEPPGNVPLQGMRLTSINDGRSCRQVILETIPRDSLIFTPTEPPRRTTIEPITEPIIEPTIEPTIEPIIEPTIEPTIEPIIEPTIEPIIEPIIEPTIEPTIEPIIEPTIEPTIEPIIEPTIEPIIEPIIEPTIEPIIEPTIEPTIEPIIEPTIEPTIEPIIEPTIEPITEPIIEPTMKPKIISEIRLRTTSTVKPTSSSPTNISTAPPPTLQRLLKRLRHQPVNVSCSSKSDINSHQEEVVDISGDLLIPIDRNANYGTKLFCPLCLIITLVLSVLLL